MCRFLTKKISWDVESGQRNEVVKGTLEYVFVYKS